MSQERADSPPTPPASPRFETDEYAEKRFRGWRLIGFILGVVALLALVSFIIDWAVIGPLEGRVF